MGSGHHMALNRRRGLLIAVLANLIAACAVVAVTFWVVGSSRSWCSSAKIPAQPGWPVRTVVSSGREPCYDSYVQRGGDPSEPVPACAF
jgi:hypothetical protein